MGRRKRGTVQKTIRIESHLLNKIDPALSLSCLISILLRSYVKEGKHRKVYKRTDTAGVRRECLRYVSREYLDMLMNENLLRKVDLARKLGLSYSYFFHAYQDNKLPANYMPKLRRIRSFKE